MLSDRDILKEINEGSISLSPFNEELIQPASIDVRISNEFRVFKNHKYKVIDPAVKQDLTTPITVEDYFVLHPGEFVLSSTLEYVKIKNLASRLEGKSSLGRLGLLTHATAGFIDPGFEGHITLELSNTANLPILLYPGMRIGQLAFFYLSSPPINLYGSSALGSHYFKQTGPTSSRIHENFNLGIMSNGGGEDDGN